MPQTLSPRVPEVVAAALAIFLCFLDALLSSACCLEPTFKSRTHGLRCRQTRFSSSRYICGFVLEVDDEADEDVDFFFLFDVDVSSSEEVASPPLQLAAAAAEEGQTILTSF